MKTNEKAIFALLKKEKISIDVKKIDVKKRPKMVMAQCGIN